MYVRAGAPETQETNHIPEVLGIIDLGHADKTELKDEIRRGRRVPGRGVYALFGEA